MTFRKTNFCIFCNGLSITHLIELAEVELSDHEFPQKAYYQHHGSYADLIKSANEGCHLCQLIHESFQATIMESYLEGYTRDEIIQDIGSRGLPTDLKICINSAHLYHNEKVEQVNLFDILMVQSGATEQSVENSDYINTVPLLELVINIPRGRPNLVGKYRVGRYQSDADLGSRSNIEIAQSWLNECTTSHKNCTASQRSILPTRVIEVGALDGSKGPRLFISNGIEHDYVTLSHCWGGAITPLLTIENLGEFQTSIPFTELPANFHDAIIITRNLGLQYLWIDSLCIIQNSKVDWEIESKKMCSIYRDAKVMISATASSGSLDGILKHPQPSQIWTSGVPLKISAGSDTDEVVYISKSEHASQNFQDLLSTSPLSRRAWTLQEGLMAPRILYYGKDQIYWQCQEGLQSADGIPAGSIMRPGEFPLIEKVAHSHVSSIPQDQDISSLLEEYYIIVQEYSKRHLTFDSDKLPAFSGIAELLHPVLGQDYLAGIWSRDLRGLLWYQDLSTCKAVEQYRAPTWSWAVTNEPVLFDYQKGDGYEDAYAAQMLSHEVVLKTLNPYGQVDSAKIVLAGFTKDLVQSSQRYIRTNTDECEFDLGTIYFNDQKGCAMMLNVQGSSKSYLLSVVDYPRYPAGEGIEPEKDWQIKSDLFSNKKYIAFSIQSYPLIRDGTDSKLRMGTGLILAEVNVDTYMRVGFFRTVPQNMLGFEDWMDSWEKRTISVI